MVYIEAKWVDLFGWEDYYKISDRGEVVRKPREQEIHRDGVVYVQKLPEYKMQGFTNTSGYRQVHLKACGKHVQKYIHVAVYESFNGIERLEGYDINHIDHDKTNNRLENLEMVTHKENMRKASDFYYSKGLVKNQGYMGVFCSVCGVEIASRSKMCRVCHIKSRTGKDRYRKVKGKDKPNKKELYNLLSDNSFVAVGKMYGVTDNAIRNWCKGYGIPYKASDYK